MMIIGLIGHARAGKGEFARIAKEEFGFEHVQFSAALLEEFASMRGMTLHHLKETKDQYRKELQEYAQRIRNVDPGYWAQKVIDAVEFEKGFGAKHIIVDGIRFWVDYGMLKDRYLDDIRFIRVVSSQKDRVKRGMRPECLNDISERFINQFPVDGVIYNIGTLEDYHDKVRTMLKNCVILDNLRAVGSREKIMQTS